MKNKFEKVITEKTNNFVNNLKQKAVYTRIFAIIFLIAASVGLLYPFVRATTSLSFFLPFGSKIVVFHPDTQVTAITGKDLITFKKVEQIELFGKTVTDYKIGGYSLYQILRNPLQNYGYLDTATRIINPQTAALLSNPQLSAAIIQYIPKYGQDISNFLQAASQITDQTSQILTSINNVVVAVRSESESVSQAIIATEKGFETADWIGVGVLGIILIAIILLCIPKVSAKIALVLTSIATFTVTASIAAVIICDKLLQNWLSATITLLNNDIYTAVRQILTQILGDNAELLNLLGGTNTDLIQFNLNLRLGTGAFILFIGLVASLTIICFIPQYHHRTAAAPKKINSSASASSSKKARSRRK